MDETPLHVPKHDYVRGYPRFGNIRRLDASRLSTLKPADTRRVGANLANLGQDVGIIMDSLRTHQSPSFYPPSSLPPSLSYPFHFIELLISLSQVCIELGSLEIAVV